MAIEIGMPASIDLIGPLSNRALDTGTTILNTIPEA